MEAIICRARLAADCHHDRESAQAFGDPDAEMHEDGTWNGHSIVCDACYCAIMPHTPSGMGLNDELDPTIKRLRAERARAERAEAEREPNGRIMR